MPSPEAVWDVHAHYVPPSTLDLIADGPGVVRVEEWNGTPRSVTVNGGGTGTTIDQLGDVGAILAAADRAGVDRRLLSPPPFTFRYWDDPGRTAAVARHLNDATAAAVARHPDRLAGLATLPLQDAAASLAELERARSLGLVGVTMGSVVAGENVTTASLEPVWEAIDAASLPVLIHPDSVPSPRWNEYLLVNMLGMPVESATALASLIFSGALERYPSLRVCFVHGGGVAPYLLGRWDHCWRVRPEPKAQIDQPPATWLDRVYFDTLTHSPQVISFMVEVVGPDNVVIGTDSPFDVGDADPLGTLARAPRLTEDERVAIRSANAARWLYG